MDQENDESGLAQRIGNAILELVKEIVGSTTHQFEIATMLGEDPSTLSKIIKGKNLNATRPLKWITHWNETQEKKIMLAFDGKTVRVAVKKASQQAKSAETVA